MRPGRTVGRCLSTGRVEHGGPHLCSSNGPRSSLPVCWEERRFFPTVLPGSSLVVAMAETRDGKSLGTAAEGLFYFRRWRTTRVTAVLPDKKINCLLPVGDKELWVGTVKDFIDGWRSIHQS